MFSRANCLIFFSKTNTHNFLQETIIIRLNLSTESFLIFILFSIAKKTMAYYFYIVIGYKVDHKFLTERFL